MKRYYNGIRLATDSEAKWPFTTNTYTDTRSQRLVERMSNEQVVAAAGAFDAGMKPPPGWPRAIMHQDAHETGGYFAAHAEKMAQVGRWR